MTDQLQDAALILVDIQNDFCPGGALAVDKGDEIVDVVNRLMPLFPLVVATQDWHPVNHISFKERGGPWPPHCLQGSRGAELHPALNEADIDQRLHKGASPDRDAYSGFEAADESGNSLGELLKGRGVEKIYVAGLATDYCVRATILDGLKDGFEVHAIKDAMRAVNVNPDDGQKALKEMETGGAKLVTSREVFEAAQSTGATAG